MSAGRWISLGRDLIDSTEQIGRAGLLGRPAETQGGVNQGIHVSKLMVV